MSASTAFKNGAALSLNVKLSDDPYTVDDWGGATNSCQFAMKLFSNLTSLHSEIAMKFRGEDII